MTAAGLKSEAMRFKSATLTTTFSADRTSRVGLVIDNLITLMRDVAGTNEELAARIMRARNERSIVLIIGLTCDVAAALTHILVNNENRGEAIVVGRASVWAGSVI
jgi:hypothetical protein